MKCLYCGNETQQLLCSKCMGEEALNQVFYEMCYFRAGTCENNYLKEYAASLPEGSAVRDSIPILLEYFDAKTVEYFHCRYYKLTKNDKFENAAREYLATHKLDAIRTQHILWELVDFYIPGDLIKAQKWCELIRERDGLACELYSIAAKYYAMIGDYDFSDILTERGFKICDKPTPGAFIFCSQDDCAERMKHRLEKQKSETEKYRTKKPYWPMTEERRRVVAMFYDERGITYPRIEQRAERVPENEFSPIKECYEDCVENYCAFWCSEAFSVVASKSIYQIAAVRIRNGKIEDTFEAYVRPWDGGASARRAAAKEIGVSIETIETADDVDLVVPKFFMFVADDILISTGALGNQAKLLSRAARYSGIKEIKNKFLDILDFAAEKSPDFDLAHNTREYLLDKFSIAEGKTALEKAKVNYNLYQALIKYGE